MLPGLGKPTAWYEAGSAEQKDPFEFSFRYFGWRLEQASKSTSNDCCVSWLQTEISREGDSPMPYLTSDGSEVPPSSGREPPTA